MLRLREKKSSLPHHRLYPHPFISHLPCPLSPCSPLVVVSWLYILPPYPLPPPPPPPPPQHAHTHTHTHKHTHIQCTGAPRAVTVLHSFYNSTHAAFSFPSSPLLPFFLLFLPFPSYHAAFSFPSVPPSFSPPRLSWREPPLLSESEGPLPSEKVPISPTEGPCAGHPSSPFLLPCVRLAVSQ